MLWKPFRALPGLYNKRMKHHLTLYWTRLHGSWSSCSCGWGSGNYTTKIGAHLAFGRHLVNTYRKEKE